MHGDTGRAEGMLASSIASKARQSKAKYKAKYTGLGKRGEGRGREGQSVTSREPFNLASSSSTTASSFVVGFPLFLSHLCGAA